MTTAMIIKKRARKPLAAGSNLIADVYHNGVGGIEGHPVCYSFEIGDFRCILTKLQWRSLSEIFRQLEHDAPSNTTASDVLNPWRPAVTAPINGDIEVRYLKPDLHWFSARRGTDGIFRDLTGRELTTEPDEWRFST